MWKVQISTILEGFNCPILGKKGFAEVTQKAGRVSSIFLLSSDVFSCSPYSRGLRYHHNFRGPFRLTNYNFHIHILYCIIFTIISVILANTKMCNVHISMILEGL